MSLVRASHCLELRAVRISHDIRYKISLKCSKASNQTIEFPFSARKKVVLLGSGWSTYTLLTKIDRKAYDVVVVSPRNHFLFTPLLASTTTGTLDFRSIIEPIRTARNDVRYYQYVQKNPTQK